MSFYSGARQNCFPGPLTGNPLTGLCEKACIHTQKIFDACMRQVQESDLQLTTTGYNPANPTLPLTFVSAVCQTGNVTINNLVVDRFEDRPCFARVSGNVVIPIIITYTDANNVTGTATGNITVNQDVVLYVPQPSIVPFRIEAFATCMGIDGEYVGTDTFSIDCCIAVITKVVVDADILVPSYGYAKIPPCQEYTQDVCNGFFDLPLYPMQNPVVNN